MAKLICIYWRDIPAQVIGRAGRRTRIKRELGARFARAIDRAAMRAGRGSSDAYLDDWRRVTEEVDDWSVDVEIIPSRLVTDVVGPLGRMPMGPPAAQAECPVAAELLHRSPM